MIPLLFLLGGALLCHGASFDPRGRGKVEFRHEGNIVETEQETRNFDLERGAAGGNLHRDNDAPPKDCRAIVFLDAVAGTEGKISAWQFYIENEEEGAACEFCVAVFNSKKTDDGTRYFVQYANSNCFRVSERTGTITDYEIPRDYRIPVNSNSMIGILYPNENSQRCIRMESNKDGTPRTNYNVRLGRMQCINQNDMPYGQPEFMPIGTIIPEYAMMKPTGYEPYMAAPSVRAIISGPTLNLKLDYGTDETNGYALIFLNGRWGTICDRWYHLKGWPKLFCDQKGLPEAEQSFYTAVGSLHHNASDLKINLMNPHCKESTGSNMFNCVSREDLPCDHSEDLFIYCGKPTKLRGGDYPWEGYCYTYRGNVWGTTCEHPQVTLSDTSNFDNPRSNHWAHVCCREAGFMGGAWKMVPSHQRERKDASMAKQPITMHSPRCEDAVNPSLRTTITKMDQCKDGDIQYHCSHEYDMYLSCRH